MGFIGSLLYPDNDDLAKKLNEEHLIFLRTQEIYKLMVSVYRENAHNIKVFDSYLMAVLTMQYHMVFSDQELDTLPAPRYPNLTDSKVKRIEELAIDAVTIDMAFKGMMAISSKVGNFFTEGGALRESMTEATELAEEIGPELESIALESDFVTSSGVEILSNTEATSEELGSMLDELSTITAEFESVFSETAGVAPEIEEAFELTNESVEIVTEAVDLVAESIEVGEISLEAATEAGAAVVETTAVTAEGAATAGSGGLAIVLLPALIGVIVATEIIGIFEAKDRHDELEDAVRKMRNLQTVADRNLRNLNSALRLILGKGILIVKSYNKVLKRLNSLNQGKKEIYKTPCSFYNVDILMKKSNEITFHSDVGNPEREFESLKSNIQKLSKNSITELRVAINTIRKQALHDSKMTDIIKTIRNHLEHTGQVDVTQEYLTSLSMVKGVGIIRVKKFDRFRKYLNQVGACLAPIHKQVIDATPKESKKPVIPQKMNTGKPDKGFVPRVKDFQTIPIINA